MCSMLMTDAKDECHARHAIPHVPALSDGKGKCHACGMP